MYYNTEIVKTNNKYRKTSKELIKKQEDFNKNLKVFNTNCKEHIEISYDFEKQKYNDFLWIQFNSIYKQDWVIEWNKNNPTDTLTPIFLTLTLPSEYHKYKKLKSKKYIKNIHWLKKKYTINQGYRKLNKMVKYLYNNFKIWDKETKKYIWIKSIFDKVIEPHKSNTPHLHSLQYIPTKYVKQFTRLFNRLVEKEKLSQVDFEVLDTDNIKGVSNYLIKYIKKTLTKDLNYLHGWKSENGINRNYTSTNMSIPRYVFEKVSNKLRLNIEDYKGQNILKVVEDMLKVDIKIYSENGELLKDSKIYKTNEDYKYNVEVSKTKIIKKVLSESYKELLVNLTSTSKIEYNFNNEKMDIEYICYKDFLHFEELEEKFEEYWNDNNKNNLTNENRFILLKDFVNKNKYYYETSYKINEFLLIDRYTEEILYKKSDYKLYSEYLYEEECKRTDNKIIENGISFEVFEYVCEDDNIKMSVEDTWVNPHLKEKEERKKQLDIYEELYVDFNQKLKISNTVSDSGLGFVL